LYFNTTGVTGSSALNAPFLNPKIALPLEVPPSGNTTIGGNLPSFWIICYLSPIYSMV